MVDEGSLEAGGYVFLATISSGVRSSCPAPPHQTEFFTLGADFFTIGEHVKDSFLAQRLTCPGAPLGSLIVTVGGGGGGGRGSWGA